MPYPGELAGKTGHSEILKNPDVAKFLADCAGIPKPTAPDFTELLGQTTKTLTEDKEVVLPEYILAIDGSSYEASIDQSAPSRRVGYVKISSVLLNFDDYRRTRRDAVRFVDPIELNKLKENSAALSFALPGSYMPMSSGERVIDGFRRQIYSYYSSDQSKLLSSLRLVDTYTHLCEIAGRIELIGGKRHVRGIRCSGVDSSGDACTASLSVPVEQGQIDCASCGTTAYVTDGLRIHEAFIEQGLNGEALNRLMTVTEHILIAHYVNAYAAAAIDVLSKLCIVVDGPLAIFGEAAWVHRAILLSVIDVNSTLVAAGLPPLMIMGFQKTGRLKEHLDEISDLLPNSSVCGLTDAYRYTYIDPGKLGSSKNFGDETYYGQDFFLKTSTGKCFAMLLPYPFSKQAQDFKVEKAKLENYPDIDRSIRVIKELETTMFGGAIVPVMLAHGNASISRMPGGKVLDIATRLAVNSKSG